MSRLKDQETTWFMVKSACPVTGLPVYEPEVVQGQSPHNQYRAEIAILGENILLLKASGYASGSDMKRALDYLDDYMHRHGIQERSIIGIEDYTHVKGADFEARRIYFAFYKEHQNFRGGVIFGVSPLFRISYRLAMLSGAIKRETFLADTYPQAVQIALKLSTDQVSPHDSGSAAGSGNARRRPSLKSLFSRRFKAERCPNTATLGNPENSDPVPRSQVDDYVNEIFNFIASVTWEEEGVRKYQREISPDNPFRPVFDIVAYIKSDFDLQLKKRKLAEETLRESEAKMRHIVESARAGIYEIDFTARKIVYVNDMIVENTGYSKRELLNMDPMDFLTPESRKQYEQRLPQILRGALTEETAEYKIVTKDGREKWALFHPLFIHGQDGRPKGASVVVTDITRQKNIEMELRQYQERLSEMTRALSMTEEKERKKLAGFLHDEIGQGLAAAKIQLSHLGSSIKNPDHKKRIDDINDYLQNEVERIRFFTSELYPPVLYDFGLTVAVEWLAERIEQTHNLHVPVTIVGHNWDISEELSVILYRAASELLHNVLKHAHAGTAVVRLDSTNGLSIEVCDDGIGSDQRPGNGSPDNNHGFGLFNIAERVKYFGGQVKIDSKPGQGFCVTLTLPDGDHV